MLSWALIVLGIIGIIFFVFSCIRLWSSVGVYFGGISTIGQYERTIDHGVGKSPGVYQYSFHDEQGQKYFVTSNSYFQQVKVVYNPVSPSENTADMSTDWFYIIFYPLMSIMIVFASFVGFKRNREEAAPKSGKIAE